MNTPEAQFAVLIKRVQSVLKPLGYKKEGKNFRLFEPDGLGKIICIKRNRWNTCDCLLFSLDIGVYFEKEPIIQNRRFKEIECQLRKVVARQDSGTLQLISGNGDWRENLEMRYWLITEDTDMEALFASIHLGLKVCFDWFDLFPDRKAAIEKILSGEADQYSDYNVMHYGNAKLLADMGYARQVYERIKDADPDCTYVVRLAQEIKRLSEEDTSWK